MATTAKIVPVISQENVTSEGTGAQALLACSAALPGPLAVSCIGGEAARICTAFTWLQVVALPTTAEHQILCLLFWLFYELIVRDSC